MSGRTTPVSRGTKHVPRLLKNDTTRAKLNEAMIVEDSHLAPRTEDSGVSEKMFAQMRINVELKKEQEDLRRRNIELLIKLAKLEEETRKLRIRLEVQEEKEVIGQKIYDKLTDDLLKKLSKQNTSQE